MTNITQYWYDLLVPVDTDACINGGIDPSGICDDTIYTCPNGQYSLDCVCYDICGDGSVQFDSILPMSECDDGNLINGDGCDQNCEIEIGFV